MAPDMHVQYSQVLLERMEAFPEGSVKTSYANRVTKLSLPKPASRQKMVSMSLTASGLSGRGLGGEELFLVPEEGLASKMLGQVLEEIALRLCIPTDGLTLLWNGRALCSAMLFSDLKESLPETVLRVDLDCDALLPLVCRKLRPAEVSLGEGSLDLDVKFDELPEIVQTICKPRTFITDDREHGDLLLSYGRAGVLAYQLRRGPYDSLRAGLLEPVGYFPMAPVWQLPRDSKQGSRNLDVWSCKMEVPSIKKLLDEHAAETQDRPLPRYEMIVDPNQFLSDTPDGPVWVPCEFDVSADGRACLVGGPRSHAFPTLAARVAQPVLEAALPLLARLRRPQLLLDERRIQVVFKAQRIIVPAAATDGSDSEYVGLWHVDGYREHIAAVVLYYYHVDEGLEGGNMEFCGREPMDVLGIGDCSNNFYKLTKDRLRSALRSDGSCLETCRVPISTGSLLVFSNYQVAHRVLRMVNRGSAEASRDFVALFLVDPARPLTPATSVLSQPYMLTRTLSPPLKTAEVQSILEFLGVSQTTSSARRLRNSLLWEQLQPSGEFCANSGVVATGNGCYTMIGWLHKLLADPQPPSSFRNMRDGEDRRLNYVRALNLAPQELDRGLSEALSLESMDFETRLALYDAGYDVTDESEGLLQP
ncbi:hypothetical protein AK812_SmicGene42267 [Symbiodinium microadriaticum]|uniref:DUF4246 domain-containing protein n=1 Tax=Symbiodinium microadriaticum TaxID=2951 RepID=A0A1Q9C430_SYMMI|nr:hypothetical protein AK812_SmicGene42267 [Symbiodinium microadriaticum]